MQYRTVMQGRRRGFTLVELAIVLGAMGMVMGAIWGVVDTVWNNYRFNKMNDQVKEVVLNIRANFGPKGALPFAIGDITGFLENNTYRLIPIEMRATPGAAGSAINHALGSVAGGSFGVEELTTTSFRIYLRGLSKANCMKMLMQFPVMIPEVGVTRLAAGGGIIGPFDTRRPAGLTADLPVNATKADELCNLTTNTNVVNYDFRLFP